MAIAHSQPRRTPPTPKGPIPDALIYEIIDGKPLYRKGYRDVVQGTQTIADIMGSSSLQALIVYYLTGFISRFIDEDAYTVLISEAGLHLDHRTNLANDIAIFDQATLPGSSISRKYASVPPRVAIEVDIAADVEEMTENGYIYKKTRKLLDFGTQKVIWVLTEAQVVMVATADRTEAFDWHRDIELLDGHCFNVGAYLTRKGVDPT